MADKPQIILYQTKDGKARVEVRFEHKNVWLTQKLMAELFDTTVPNINMHLKSVFKTGELKEDSVIKDFLITASDSKNYKVKMYSLEAIIAGRVDSKKPLMGLTNFSGLRPCGTG